MIFTDDEAAELKTWVVKKLEDISDADSDVLADYVLALLRADSTEGGLRADAIQNLNDFLQDNTVKFVDDLFVAIHSRAYIPGHSLPSSASHHSPTFSAPTGPAGSYGQLGSRDGLYTGTRKRSWNDRADEMNGSDSHYGRNDRQMKQMRRGGPRGARGDGFDQRGGRMGQQPYGQLPTMPPSFAQGLPNMPPAMPFPPLAPNDAAGFADMIAAMGFPSLASMPPIPQAASPPNFVPNGGQRSPGTKMPMKNKINARCRDYDTKGYCTRGNACPFEHGNDHMVVHHPDEYDPKNSVMVNLPQTSPINGHSRLDMPLSNTPTRGSFRSRGDRGTHASRGRGRAEFSSLGPNNDRSITSIVVEQIPEEKFDEGSVREFFSAFGTITEVTMQPYKHLAIVQYDNYYSARNAYDSPKVIFDNRFVKVYWYNPNTLPTPPANGTSNAGSPTANRTEEPAYDREEFERNAAAAQKKLEEKKALMEEAKAKKLKLQAEKEELERRQAEEKQKLKEALAAKGLSIESSETKTNGINGTVNGEPSSQTEALRAKVAALEAEAKSLGLDTALSEEPWAPRGRGRGRGRGSYRGWEGFAGHANTFDSARGAYRGRASYRGRGGGTHSLDNRTKKVAVSGVDFDMAKDEALRQFLLGIGQFEAIDPHPSKPGSQIVAFKDRFTAESFLHGAKDIPGVGKVELTWVNTPLAPIVAGTKDGSGDTGMGEAGDERKEVDYDVAEDDDRWMDEVS